MTSHISEDLPRLLTGEAARDEVLDAAAHLRTCPDCQQELVSAVVAHAALTSAHRFAPEIVARDSDEPADVEALGGPLPDLSAVFAQVRAETAAPAPAPRRSRAPAAIAAVAAVAAGMLIGGGVVALTVDRGGSSGGSQAEGRPVVLAPYDTGRTPAIARVSPAGRMTIDATSLPDPGRQKRYEVWLTDAKRSRMQPVGWIGPNGTATLTVPADLMGNFQDIEVSVQDVTADSYDYSGTSVLRGSYA